ncbi:MULTISPECIES: flagellar biosynthesis anti-sigma factor FlgM [unclassified Halomonas]|uniref:flagellar biosynthesis anti-sigma factor FlgM n=1 Tax=unclassified Halomonas TaxID=2609666 RepID=UPI00209EE187|nr:flagellar biosynthesis anti-sigma factor FlgM [Halomonas sp. 707D7]MCP1326120.1 flagellar biosynthesis anti-sigma factor FlgM [Halomonas sp. 707D4]
MKIDNHNPLPRTHSTQQREETQKVGGAQSSPEGNTTRESTRLSQMHMDDSQDIDMARVEEIRDAIRDGRLEIRADRIADSLIAQLQE